MWVLSNTGAYMCVGENMTVETMPYDERDDDTGQFAAEVSDEELLEAVREADHATTSNISEAVGLKHRSGYDRLEKLEEDGLVEREKVNARLVFWNTTDEEGDT